MNNVSGGLTLAGLFQATGLEPQELLVIRHTLKPDGLRTRADAMGPKLLPYVREQGIQNSKIPATPPRFWLNFLATTGWRARFIIAHENHGEVLAERTEDRRFFDLQPTPVFAALADRLVIEWTKDAVNWAKTGDQASYNHGAGGRGQQPRHLHSWDRRRSHGDPLPDAVTPLRTHLWQLDNTLWHQGRSRRPAGLNSTKYFVRDARERCGGVDPDATVWNFFS